MGLSTRSKRKLGIVAAVALIGVAGVVALWFFQQGQRADREAEGYRLGTAAYEEQDWEGVLKHLGAYLRNNENKSDADAVFKMADARRRVPLENNRHLESATAWARDARSLAPDDPRPLELLMQLYTMKGQLTELLDTTDRLLQLDPSHREALETRLQSLAVTGKMDEADKAARDLIEKYPDDSRAHWHLVSLMVVNEEPVDEMLEYANAQAQQHPDDIGFALLRTRVKLHAGDRAGARDSIRIAIDRPAPDADMLRQVLTTLDILGMQDEAERFLEINLGHEPVRDEAKLIAAERLWKGGDLPGAIAELRSDDAPVSEYDDRRLGWAAFFAALQGESDEALSAEFGGRASEDAERWKLLIRVADALRDGRAAEAKSMLAPLALTDSRNELVAYLLGETELALGESASAIEHFDRAVSVEPRWLPVKMRLVDLLLKAGEIDRAHQHAAEAQIVFRNRAAPFEALSLTSTALVERGDADRETIDEVISLLTELDKELEDNAVALARLARVYIAIGNTSEAQGAIDRLLATDRTMQATEWLVLAERAERTGLDGADALRAKTGEDSGAPALFLALQAADEGRADEGKTMLREAVRTATGEQKLLARLSLANYLAQIRDPEAAEAYKSLSDDYSENARVQLEVLRSESVWTSESVVAEAIQRLRGLTGEAAINWRNFEARRLLVFDGSERAAADAAGILNEVLVRDPDEIDALLLSAEAMRVLEDPSIIDYLRRAADAAPDRPALRHALVAELIRLGRIDEAEGELTATNDDTMSAQARRRRVDLMIEAGMLNPALSQLDLLGAEATATDYVTRARVLSRLGREDEADRYVTRALDSENPGAAVVLPAAEHYARTSRLDLAEQTLARLGDDVTAERRERIMVSLIERYGDPGAAEERYVEAARASNDADAWASVARLRLARNDMDGAEEAARAGLAIEEEHPRLKSFAEVIGVIRKLPESDTIQRQALIGVATSEVGEAQSKTLGLLRDRAGGRLPRDAYIRGVQSITEQYPNFFPAWSLLAYERVVDRKINEAIVLYQTAGEKNPLDPSPYRLASELLRREGRTEEALAAAERWRSRVSGSMAADLTVAGLSADLGRWSEALRRTEPWSEQLVEGAERNPDALMFYARCLAANGRVSEAERLLADRVASDTAWRRRALSVGLAIRNDGEARRWVSRTAQRLDDLNESRLELGRVWHNLAVRTRDPEDHARVIAAFEPLVESNGTAAVLSAVAYEARGDLGSAERIYRRAVEIRPNDAVVINNLAYLLLKQNNGSETEALALSQRAVAMLNDNTPPALSESLLETLGSAQLATGNPEDAEETFRRGLRIKPGSVQLLIGLGESLAAQDKLDDLSRLLPEIERALTIADDDDGAFAARVRVLREKIG